MNVDEKYLSGILEFYLLWKVLLLAVLGKKMR